MMTVKEVIEQYENKYDFAICFKEDTDEREFWLDLGRTWIDYRFGDSANRDDFNDAKVLSLDFESYAEEKTILIIATEN